MTMISRPLILETTLASEMQMHDEATGSDSLAERNQADPRGPKGWLFRSVDGFLTPFSELLIACHPNEQRESVVTIISQTFDLLWSSLKGVSESVRDSNRAPPQDIIRMTTCVFLRFAVLFVDFCGLLGC
jgi:hypothetical protein